MKTNAMEKLETSELSFYKAKSDLHMDNQVQLQGGPDCLGER